jgi:PEP-CTERM motif
MKKLVLTLSAMTIAASILAQGTINTLNTGGASLLVTTNGALYGEGTGLTSGNGYIYALMENASTAVTGGNVSGVLGNNNALDSSSWTFSGVYMTNLNGGLLSGGASAVDNMWAPNTTNAFFVIGWSVNFGTTWGAISNALAFSVVNGGNWSQMGYFGASAVGFGVPGGGSPALPTPHLWAASPNNQMTGLTGFSLNAVPVPEPGTLALAGLGGLSLLLFRRQRK